MLEDVRKKWQSEFDSFLRKRFRWLPTRIALGIMIWFGQVNLYMTRVNISVAIVAMVKRNVSGGQTAACISSVMQEENTNFSIPKNNSLWSDHDENLPTTTTLQAFEDEEGDFLWSETIQGFILGSFFYGYTFTQVLGGRMAELYGTKMVYGICMFGGGMAAILSPVAARLHYGALIAVRIIQGLFQGVSWPALHACTSRWIPPTERGKFISIVYLAATLSSAITMPLVGAIIANHGWASQFYVMGMLSLIWCCVWYAFMFNSPEEHPRINPEELEYIETSLKEGGTKKSTSKRVPWRNIMTSMPVWAILVYSIGNGWGISLLFAQLPTYMKNVLGFSIKANGGISAIPFLCRYIGGIIWSTICDWLISKKIWSVTTARKFFSILALGGPGIMIIGVSFGGCNSTLSVALFCVALFFNGATTSSGLVNHTDIAPNFAGTLLGITNTIGSIISFVVPVVTGVMIDGQQTIEAWQRVFWICAPMYLLAEIFYLTFASGEVQHWNDIDSVRGKKHKTSDIKEPAEDASLRINE